MCFFRFRVFGCVDTTGAFLCKVKLNCILAQEIITSPGTLVLLKFNSLFQCWELWVNVNVLESLQQRFVCHTNTVTCSDSCVLCLCYCNNGSVLDMDTQLIIMSLKSQYGQVQYVNE